MTKPIAVMDANDATIAIPSKLAAALRWLWRLKYTALNILILLAVWQAFSGYTPQYIFPSIPTVLTKFGAVLTDPSAYRALLDTLRRILGGFFLSASLGIVLGVLVAMSSRANEMIGPTLRIVLGVPALTWVLLAIVWFRSPEIRVWFLMFVLVFPIVAVNTADGVRSVPAELYQMVRSLRPSRIKMLRILILPAATPFIFSGLKVSLSFGGRIVVFAEALSANSGVGAEMYTANQLFDTAGVIVWTMILIGVLSALDLLLQILERRWFRWRVSLST